MGPIQVGKAGLGGVSTLDPRNQVIAFPGDATKGDRGSQVQWNKDRKLGNKTSLDITHF